MKYLVILLGFTLSIIAAPVLAQHEFDRPEVIQTNFLAQMAEKNQKADGTSSQNHGPSPASFGMLNYGETAIHGSYGTSDCCGSCDSGGCYSDCGCASYEGNGFSLSVHGIVDVPLDGIFHTGDDSVVSAGDLGIPTGILAPATVVELLFNEQQFDDIYRTLGGFDINLTMDINCSTTMFLGYRLTSGSADEIEVGRAVFPVAADEAINAQFSPFTESQLQVGFLSSHCWKGQTNFLWGGRIGIGFVDQIDVDLNIPTYVALDAVPFYDDSTTLTFGFNMGFERAIGCHMTARVISGLEYRSRLEGDDSVLGTLGLDELNDGSGFASIPVYMGFTYRR